MSLAIIILNWNGLKVLPRFLPSVVATTKDSRVRLIIADNGSSDGSADWVKENFPEIELLEFSENLGFAGGYDRAIRLVGAEYTLLLNSDVETPDGWWQPLLDFMEANPRAGAVQPKILSYRDRTKFEHAGAAGGLIDSLGFPYCRGRVLWNVAYDRGQYDSDSPVEVAWASGAAMLVRTKAYIEAGGLDPNFFAHMEEIDLCWRMWQKGYRVYSLTSSEVYHYGGGSLPYGNPKKTYFNFRNNLLMLHKNLPRGAGRKFLLKRRLIDALSFFFFIAKGEIKNARALLKAHKDFRNLKKRYCEFPDKNIFGDLPGTRRSILLNRKP